MPAYRSFLFAPGNHARKVAKVFDCGADHVILDLEDAVAKAEKVATRALVVEALKRPRKGGAYVRVNAFNTEFCYGDAVAVVGPGLDGIILPMVESREQIVAFDWLVGALERERGLPPGGIDIIPIIETGKGIANARAIAAAGTRVKRMAFGAGDYTLDMNMEWTLAETELEHARAEMVVASRAAGLEAPIDTVWVHINDLEGLARSAKRARQLGFQGKMCIYPPQVERVNARVHADREGDRLCETRRRGFREGGARGLLVDPAGRLLHRLSDRLQGATHARHGPRTLIGK